MRFVPAMILLTLGFATYAVAQPKKTPRLDFNGEPFPEGAIARRGTPQAKAPSAPKEADIEKLIDRLADVANPGFGYSVFFAGFGISSFRRDGAYEHDGPRCSAGNSLGCDARDRPLWRCRGAHPSETHERRPGHQIAACIWTEVDGLFRRIRF